MSLLVRHTWPMKLILVLILVLIRLSVPWQDATNVLPETLDLTRWCVSVMPLSVMILARPPCPVWASSPPTWAACQAADWNHSWVESRGTAAAQVSHVGNHLGCGICMNPVSGNKGHRVQEKLKPEFVCFFKLNEQNDLKKKSVLQLDT